MHLTKCYFVLVVDSMRHVRERFNHCNVTVVISAILKKDLATQVLLLEKQMGISE